MFASLTLRPKPGFALTLLLGTFLTTVAVRLAHPASATHENSDATYHALLTATALREQPIRTHFLLPTVTLGHEPQDVLPWGSTVRTVGDAYVYTSFTSAAFVVLSAFQALLPGLSPLNALLLLGLLIHAASAFLLYLTVLKLHQGSRWPAVAASLAYLTFPETLVSHGHVYWAHSLFQPLYHGVLLQCVRIWSVPSARLRSHFFLGVLVFVSAWVEWSGFILALGVSLCGLAHTWTQRGDYRQKLLAGLPLLSVGLAGVSIISHFVVGISAPELLARLQERSSHRSGSLRDLFDFGPLYWGSLRWFLPVAAVGAFGLLRRNTSDGLRRSVAFVAALLLLEHCLLVNHARIYHFDRLKGATLAALLVGEAARFFASSRLRSLILATILGGAGIAALLNYSTFRVRELPLAQTNQVIDGASAWSRGNPPSYWAFASSTRGFLTLKAQRGVGEWLNDVDTVGRISRSYGTRTYVWLAGEYHEDTYGVPILKGFVAINEAEGTTSGHFLLPCDEAKGIVDGYCGASPLCTHTFIEDTPGTCTLAPQSD